MGEPVLFDGHDATVLARALDAPRVVLFESTGSTMDEAHALAASGAAAGTVVIAERQTAGRGRGGNRWESEAGQGLWMTTIERPNDSRAVDVLSIRLGLRASRALDRYADSPVRLKWPNDLYLAEGKLGGILVEARWRSSRIDWVAVGIGVNVREPVGVANAAALRPGTDRVEVLGELFPAVRAAANARGLLTPDELREFASRDLAVGRTCVEPASGEVRGINESGELLVDTGAGVRAIRGGSLIFGGAIA